MKPTGTDLGLLDSAIALGVVFVMHGGQKLFVMGPSALAGFLASLGVPFPEVNAGLAIAAELGGGLALLAGAFTRLAGLATAFTMVVATVTVHLANGFFLPAGFEFTLTLLLASLAIVLTGPGAYSVDAWLASRSSRFVAPARPLPAEASNEAMQAMRQCQSGNAAMQVVIASFTHCLVAHCYPASGPVVTVWAGGSLAGNESSDASSRRRHVRRPASGRCGL